MNRLTMRLGAAAASAAAAFATLGMAPAAHASITGCPTGYACVWKDSGYTTAGSQANSYKFVNYQAHFGNVKYSNTGYGVGDSASSVYNSGTGGEKAYFYKDAQCKGAISSKTAFGVAANTGDTNLNNGTPAGDLNDELSSGAFASQISRCYTGT